MRLWSFITALALATGVGIVIRQDPGYALFAYGNWSVEMPLWVTAVLLVIAVAVIVIILWMINGVFSSSEQVKIWWKKHQERTARLQMYRGLLELTEGRWQNAERFLSQSAKHSETPLINYLSAAKAAEEMDEPERRDRYLQLAFDVSAGSEVAVRLTQAQLQLKHGELEQSIGNLQRLQKETPRHPQVLRLLCTLYEAVNDWGSLFRLLPALRDTKVFPKEVLERLELKIYPALLPYYAEKGLKPLMSFWQESPSLVQLSPIFVRDYAKLLIQQGALDEAETALRYVLKKIWHEDLIHLYGLAIGRQPKKQLQFAESLLADHFNNPMLLLTIGRLYISSQLWGKARESLERSLSLKPLPETYAELADLMDRLGLNEKRDEYYKKGLLMAAQTLSQVHGPYC